MKEGWEYKTLEEVCNINYGTRVVQKKDKGTTYYVYGGGGATFMIDRYNREDCFIVSRFAMSPKCTRFVKGKFFLNDSGLSVSTNHDNLNQRYLDRALLANNDNIYSMGKGLAQRNLDMPSFRKLVIPIPPLAEQERIVAELDLLSSIIEKKKAQLKELDQLAQSIFYDMFGDPITNEKGWEVKKLKDSVQEMFLGPFGSALKVSCYVPESDAFAMVYEQKHAIQGTLEMENHFINKEKFDSLSRFEVKPKDFIMSCRGTIGRIFQLPENAPKGIIHPSLMKIRIKDEVYGYTFFVFLLKKIIAEQTTKGNCVQMAITAKELGNMDFPLPPLPLQQEFADKVEAIERQKSLIQQSIVETQTLFDSRMDYWFG